jgi:uncharacterized protein
VKRPYVGYQRVFLAFTLILLSSGCSGLFFHPWRRYVSSPADLNIKYSEVSIPSTDGVKLTTWIVSPRGKRLGTVLFFHGNAQNMSTHFYNVEWLVRAGYQMVLFDYRGYGSSSGSPTVGGLVRDGKALLRYVVKEFEKDTLIVLGQSLGGVVALAAVAESPHVQREIAAIVLEGVFSGYQSIARETLKKVRFPAPIRWILGALVGFHTDSCARLDDITQIPVLLIHGKEDSIVPVSEAQRLMGCVRSQAELWVLPQTNHIEAMKSEGIRSRLLSYFTKLPITMKQ